MGFFWGGGGFHKKAEKIVKIILFILVRCQITVVYLHSWREKLILVVVECAWLISDFSEPSSVPIQSLV